MSQEKKIKAATLRIAKPREETFNSEMVRLSDNPTLPTDANQQNDVPWKQERFGKEYRKVSIPHRGMSLIFGKTFRW